LLWSLARQLLSENEHRDEINLKKISGGDVSLLIRLEVLARYPNVSDDEAEQVLATRDRQPQFLATMPWHRYPQQVGRRTLWVRRHLVSAGVRVSCHIGDTPGFNNSV
jgi:hypothetical protein